MRNLFLIGLPGSGKTTVGRLAARELGLPFVDCDEAVSHEAGMTIPEIFRQEGEDAFRNWESRCLASLAAGGGKVIATGGGVVLRPENHRILARGLTVFLDRTPEAILAGCELGDRPLLATTSLQALSEARRELYLACADVTITDEEPLTCAAVAAAYWREQGCVY